MKHIVGLTKHKPRAADEFQDIICLVNETMIDLLEAKGGNVPTKDFIADKCALPGTGGA